jgi:hypothetical protein
MRRWINGSRQRHLPVEAGIENSHLRNGSQEILNYSCTLQFRVNVQWRKCRNAGDCPAHLGGDHHGILEMWAAMDYPVPHGINVARRSDNLGITAHDLLNRSRTICSREVTLSSFFCTTLLTFLTDVAALSPFHSILPSHRQLGG